MVYNGEKFYKFLKNHKIDYEILDKKKKKEIKAFFILYINQKFLDNISEIIIGEEPDIIVLNNEQQKSGFEITELIYNQEGISKQRTLENFAKRIEKYIQKKKKGGFFAQVSLKGEINISQKNREEKIQDVSTRIIENLDLNKLEKNSYYFVKNIKNKDISKITYQKKKDICIEISSNAYFCNDNHQENNKILEETIFKKSEKLKTYVKNTGKKQIYLIIFIVGGENSFDEIKNFSINNKLGFKNIYLVNFFNGSCTLL